MKDIVLRSAGTAGAVRVPRRRRLLLADAAFTVRQVSSRASRSTARSACGAPITAYNRISDERCTIHSNIYEPDYVVVVDETLLDTVDVTAGLKKEGAIVINSERPAAELRPLLQGYEGRVCTIDAGKISAGASGGVLPQHPHAGRHCER